MIIAPEDVHTYPWDAIYLSPHLDDVVLSCGGQIARFTDSGQRILIATIMTGSPVEPLTELAAFLHDLWKSEGGLQGDDPVAARRDEDLTACAVLDAEAVHLGFVDSLYRRRDEQALYPDVGALFGAPNPADTILEDLILRFRELPQTARIVAPLGVGGHVDHILVREAAESVFGPERLEFYEDFPYSRKWRSLQKALGLRTLLGRGELQSRVWALEEEEVEIKCEATACYVSQVGPLFRDEETMRRRVRRAIERIDGERLWWRRAE